MKAFREENYLKAIYQIYNADTGGIVTITEIANTLGVKPPSVLEKLNILVKKGFISYNKVQGAKLTKAGKEVALNIVRKHRIWETYLYKQLGFSWSEIHEIAEQLEHIDSEKLIDRIYEVIGKPDFDPHGDPIPSRTGKMPVFARRPLANSFVGCKCRVLGVGIHHDDFLDHLTALGIQLNDVLIVEAIKSFDGTMVVRTKGKKQVFLSDKVARNLFVSCIKEKCECKR